MASTVNIGTLQGVLAMRDEFSAQLQKFETRIKAVEAKTQGFSRTQKSEADKIRDAYNKVAASLDPVVARTQKYERTVETLNRALKAGVITQSQYNAQLLKAQVHLQATTHWTQRLGASIASDLSSQLTRWFAVSAAIALVAGTLKQLVTVTIEKEKSERLLEAAIKRSAAASDISRDSAIDLADAMSRLTGVDDDAIIAAEAVALRYNRISSKIFPDVTKAALDLAAATGKDLSSAMEFVAKMVNNPLRALTLLNREGYAVGKSQSDLIKKLLASNDILGAQEQILLILQARYGGTAAEMRDTMGGALTALSTAWENMLEEMGEGSITPFREAVESMIGLIELLTDTVLDDSNLIIQAWAGVAVQVNLAIAAILRSLAELIDIAGKAIVFLGLAGLALRTIGSDRLKAGAFAAEANVLKFTTQLLSQQTSARKKSIGVTLEQTEAESKLNDALRKQAEAITAIRQKQAESIQVLSEKLALAQKGPSLDSIERLKIEQQINDAHEYRVDLLELQSKFGAKIGKELADVNRRIRELGREIELKLKITLQLPKIDLDPAIKDLFNNVTGPQGMDDLLKTLSIMEENENAFREYAQAQQDWLDDYTQQWRDSWKTIDDLLAEEVAAIEASSLTAIEKERALAQARADALDAHLAQWGGFFSFLGSALGGVFQQISQAISNIQSAYQGGQQLGGMMGGSWGSTMGGIFATAAIFYEVYKAVSADIKRDRARTWGDMTSLSVTGGQFSSPSYFSQAGREMSFALEQMVRDLVDSLDAVLRDLPKIVIRSRKDGKEFSAYVAGVFVGTFRDAQSALEAAVASAIQQADWSAISEEFRIALEASVGATMDELQRNLDTARAARRARLGDTGSQYVEVADTWRQEIDAARRLGLAVDDMIKARNRELEALKNSVLGIDTTVSDQLAALSSLNRGIAEASTGMRASMEDQIRALMEQIAYMESHGPKPGTGGGEGSGGGSGGRAGGGYAKDAQSEWEETLARLRSQLAEYLDELDKIPEALSDQELNMGIFDALYKYLENDKKYAAEAVKYAKIKVEIEFALIKQQLILLGKWEEFQAMFNDAFAAAQQAAGRTGRGGGRGGGERESARDFIRDRRFELSLIGLTDYQRALAELNKQYDDLITQAGKDKKLKADLLALKKEELALLAREEGKRINQNVEDFLTSTSDFENIRRTAQGLITDIESSPFGDARKARVIGRVLAEVDKQIDRLSRETAVGLFRDMLSGLERAGVAEEELSSLRQNMAVIEHVLNVENYRTRISLLKAEGNLSREIMAELEKAFAMIEKIDPLALLGGGGLGGGVEKSGPIGMEWIHGRWQKVVDAVSDTSNTLEDAQNLLKKYKDNRKDPLTSRLEEINEDFIKITSALGSTADIIAEKNMAIKEAYEDAFSGIQDFYEDLLIGSTSHLSTQEQYTSALSKYNSLVSKLQAGDFAAIEGLEDILPDLEGLAEKMFGTSTSGFADFRSSILSDLEGIFAALGIGGGLNGLTDLGNLSSVLEGANLISPASAQQPSIDAIHDSSSEIVKSIEGSSNRRDALLRDAIAELTMVRQHLENGVITTQAASGSLGWGYGN